MEFFELIPGEVLLQIGLSVIFLALFLYTYRESKATIKEKDERIAKMTDDLMQAYSKQAEATSRMETAINNNTRTVERLCDKVST